MNQAANRKTGRPRKDQTLQNNNSFKDITGQTFSKLTAKECVGSKNNVSTWLCECECGNMVEVQAEVLKSGRKTSCGCDIVPAKTIDPDKVITEGERRLREHNKGRKGNTQKAEETREIALKMDTLWNAAKVNRGMHQKLFRDADTLVQTIDAYLAAANRIGLMPTKSGLCLYVDISADTYNAYKYSGTDCSEVLQKFEFFISEFFNQSGLNMSTNPAFPIYFGKSVMGQSDQPDTIKIQHSFATPYLHIPIETAMATISGTPCEPIDDVKYTEVDA